MANINTGLIWDEHDDRDWVLNGKNLTIVERLEQLQYDDGIDFIYSQNQHKQHGASCTKFAPINALGINKNKERTWQEINTVEALSLQLGRAGFPNGRSRARGVSTLVKYWNDNNTEDDHVMSFLGQINSEHWKILMQKGYTCVVSIRVGHDFVRDATTGVIKDYYSDTRFAHATCVRYKNGQYEFADSSRGNKRRPAHGYYQVTESIFEKMLQGGNLARDFHVILYKNPKTMITPDVPQGQYYSDAVQRAIDNGITTSNKDTKFNPHDNIKRCDVVVMLQRMYNLLQNKDK